MWLLGQKKVACRARDLAWSVGSAEDLCVCEPLRKDIMLRQAILLRLKSEKGNGEREDLDGERDQRTS